MSTLNGIGTTLLGISLQNSQSEATATRWFTLFYLPIAPLKRYKLRFLPHQGTGFSYEILAETPLVWREIAQSYLFGWLLFPLLIFWPAALAIREVWLELGLPESLNMPFTILAIIWLVTAVWKLHSWHENRGRPFHP